MSRKERTFGREMALVKKLEALRVHLSNPAQKPRVVRQIGIGKLVFLSMHRHLPPGIARKAQSVCLNTTAKSNKSLVQKDVRPSVVLEDLADEKDRKLHTKCSFYHLAVFTKSGSGI